MKFKEGVRVLIAIQRKKENKEVCWKDRHVKTLFSKSEEEFDEKFEKLDKFCDTQDGSFRIYSSVNSRNLKKSVRKFKSDQLDVDYADETSFENFYFNIKSKFISCLMRPENRNETIFKFDVDTKDNKINSEIESLLLKNTELITRRETKNGFHYFSKPFNYTVLNQSLVYCENVDFSKDGLVLLKYKNE